MADREKIKLIGKGDIVKTAIDVANSDEVWKKMCGEAPMLMILLGGFAGDIEKKLFAEDETDIFEKEN